MWFKRGECEEGVLLESDGEWGGPQYPEKQCGLIEQKNTKSF